MTNPIDNVVVSGSTPRVTATYIRGAGAAGAYAAGDIIANSETAASVVPITFNVARNVKGGSGRITGLQCVISAASGTVVLPAFDLLGFMPATNIPFAAGSYPADNDVWNITAAQYNQLLFCFSFSSGNWRTQAGAYNTAAGTVLWQPATVLGRPFAPFNTSALQLQYVRCLMQAQNAWNPGAVANTFQFTMDVDQD